MRSRYIAGLLVLLSFLLTCTAVAARNVTMSGSFIAFYPGAFFERASFVENLQVFLFKTTEKESKVIKIEYVYLGKSDGGLYAEGTSFKVVLRRDSKCDEIFASFESTAPKLTAVVDGVKSDEKTSLLFYIDKPQLPTNYELRCYRLVKASQIKK